MPPRIIFISDHGRHGRLLTQVMRERSIPLTSVVVCLRPGKSRFSFWFWKVLSRVRRFFSFYRAHKPFYAVLDAPVIRVEGINSAVMQKTLSRLAPDYIILGCSSILKPHIIETARCGVLNAHPGLLPWVRGSGVVGHALDNKIAVGCTVHFIDAGIDTGGIIERRLLPIESLDKNLPDLEAANSQLTATLMVDVVASLVQSGQIPSAIPQHARFPLFRWPDAEGRRRHNTLAKSGRGLELFESWKLYTDGEPYWRLPPEMLETPPVHTLKS